MSGTRCAECGHSLADHDAPTDDPGCYAAVLVEAGNDQGPDVQPSAWERCYCPTFQTEEPTPMSLVPTDPQAPAAAHHVPAIRDTLTEGQMDVLRRTIAHDLTDDEFDLFAAVSRRTGLDPFKRQIWAVKRRTNQRKKDDNGRWVDNWVDVMQIQTGIDGYRTIAERSGQYGGPASTEWCGPDGQWTDVWLSSTPPAAARVGVLRRGFANPIYGVAIFAEFVATKGQGDNKEPTGQWKTMPAHMIAKCAEALAIRKAFPDDTGGVYTVEEMGQADNGGAAAHDRPGIPARDFDELVAASEQLTAAQLDEVKAWCTAEGIALKRAELTSENAHRVMERILELVRSGGGGSDVPPDGGVPTAPPPPTSSGGGGAAVPAPSAAATPGDTIEPGGEGSPHEGDGAGDVPGPAPAPSGGHTLTQLDQALLTAAGRPTIPASKTVVLRAAATHGHTGTYDELLDDENLALAVLAELGGTIPTDTDPAPLDLTPWKQQDEKAWDTWRRRCNAMAGPGTKTKPHPRILDEDKSIYDEQRHALAYGASRKVRGEGCEVTSWGDLTEQECRMISRTLEMLGDGYGILTFGDTGSPGGWVVQSKAEVAA